MWLKNNKCKIIIATLIITVLAAVFIGIKGSPQNQSENIYKSQSMETPDIEASSVPDQKQQSLQAKYAEEEIKSSSNPQVSVKPSDDNLKPVTQQEKEQSCTISVSCAVLLNNIDLLSEEKRGLVPQNGWLLAPTSIVFSEGESVFDVLKRTLNQKGIHIEFVNTPAFKSAYIEGIGNLYEFDAGSLSGWMYRVNGVFPNYGCSRYMLKNGDVIEWLYTCDLGADIGGKNDYGA